SKSCVKVKMTEIRLSGDKSFARAISCKSSRAAARMAASVFSVTVVAPRIARVGISGFWISDFGFRISGFGFRISGFGFRILDFGFRISGFGFRISDFGLRIWETRLHFTRIRALCRKRRAAATVQATRLGTVPNLSATRDSPRPKLNRATTFPIRVLENVRACPSHCANTTRVRFATRAGRRTRARRRPKSFAPRAGEMRHVVAARAGIPRTARKFLRAARWDWRVRAPIPDA